MSVAKHTYELTYIVNAVISDDQIKDLVKRVSTYITESGGEVIDSDEWGSRRLAFPIQKKRNGYYVNLYFRSSGSLIARLERALEIDDNILRYLTLRMDAKMLRHYERQKSNAAKSQEEKDTAEKSDSKGKVAEADEAGSKKSGKEEKPSKDDKPVESDDKKIVAASTDAPETEEKPADEAEKKPAEPAEDQPAEGAEDEPADGAEEQTAEDTASAAAADAADAAKDSAEGDSEPSEDPEKKTDSTEEEKS